MKRYLLLSLLFVAFVGCKKNSKRPPSVEGTWELRQHIGMHPTIVYSPGNDTILKFTGTNYERYIGSQRTENGTYRVMKDMLQGYEGYIEGNRIIFNNIVNDSRTFYRIDSNRLSISYGIDMQDGATLVYERIN